jgi:hypothetical protein
MGMKKEVVMVMVMMTPELLLLAHGGDPQRERVSHHHHHHHLCYRPLRGGRVPARQVNAATLACALGQSTPLRLPSSVPFPPKWCAWRAPPEPDVLT